MDPETILLKNHAKKLGVKLHQPQLAQFDLYKNELLQWNAKTNLISENSSHDIITRHFLDSLTAVPFITQPQSLIIDIGCGAGFPGIPIKIARPELELYLLEANRKKVSFLKHIIRLLNLSSIQVLHDRVENIIKHDLWKGKFDILISRATFKLAEFILLSDFFLAPGGHFIAMKGPHTEEEMKQFVETNASQKITQFIQHDIEADFLDAPRKIIIGKK